MPKYYNNHITYFQPSIIYKKIFLGAYMQMYLILVYMYIFVTLTLYIILQLTPGTLF